MMKVREVVRVLYGAAEDASPGASSMEELRHAVDAGLPKEALRNTVLRVVDSRESSKYMNRIVPPATLARRTRLTAEESARVERLARVIATAEHVLGGEQAARDFMRRPHPLLSNESPLDLSTSELGARQIEELLWRIYYGVGA